MQMIDFWDTDIVHEDVHMSNKLAVLDKPVFPLIIKLRRIRTPSRTAYDGSGVNPDVGISFSMNFTISFISISWIDSIFNATNTSVLIRRSFFDNWSITMNFSSSSSSSPHCGIKPFGWSIRISSTINRTLIWCFLGWIIFKHRLSSCKPSSSFSML